MFICEFSITLFGFLSSCIDELLFIMHVNLVNDLFVIYRLVH